MRDPHQPITTYRLQLHARFTFADATPLVPYLDALGISHIYASPFLKASPGSVHGYDICDHGQLNPELGTPDDFDRLTGALRTHGMGLILDFVPNHMGLDPATNRWWRSVLTHGPSSPFADYFDIDWHPLTRELEDRVLLPVLQAPYGDVLERGDLQLALACGGLTMNYGDQCYPLEPRSTAIVLRLALSLRSPGAADTALAPLTALAADLESLTPYSDPSAAAQTRRVAMTAESERRLAELCAGDALIDELMSRAVVALNGVPGEPASFDRLHALLEAQPYRLAYWRTAFDEINYRRFFDVNGLGGLRMEHPPVFDAAHHFVIDLIRGGKIQGLRIDHPDGLFDPAGYFAQLQARIAEATGARETPFHVSAEKILADGETIPDDWAVAGTTGYGFLHLVNGLFVDRSLGSQMAKAHLRLAGRREPFEEHAYHSKRLIMSSSMASELNVLVHLLKDLAAADRHTRDFTAPALRRTILETVACFPIYRTYITLARLSAADREAVDVAVDRARRRNPVMPSALFLFLRNVLLATGDQAVAQADGKSWLAARRHFAMKFQQFSAPVHAKGVEDTAFYRHAVLLSLNEVGGDPAKYGETVETFHAGTRVRLERWPLEMLASSTHDTKRGEDARARLNVLSEIPQLWHRAVAGWMRLNMRRRTVVDRQPAPDRTDEYIFYQALVGAWPAEPADAPLPLEAPPDLVQRMQLYMHKVAKEAKRHTSWIGGNAAYEDAMVRFVESTLTGRSAAPFLARFVPLARQVGHAGMENALAQVVLKLTSPGVPDTYQGSELWNLDLADPDNRREVDFAVRQAMLAALMPSIERAEHALTSSDEDPVLAVKVRECLETWSDGRIKLFVTACLARWRRRDAELFQDGTYQALAATGSHAARVVAYERRIGERAAVVVVPRLTHGAIASEGASFSWADTRLIVGERSGPRLRHVLTGAVVDAERDASGTWSVPLDAVFPLLPVAVLAPVTSPSPPYR